MNIQGRLADFSLAELLRLLGEGQQTGLLQLDDIQLGFIKGQIVGASLRVWDWHQSLVVQGWLRPETLERLRYLYCRQAIQQPFGQWLVTQGVLNDQQSRWLFTQQVVRPICRLFALPDASFSFQPQKHLPRLVLTGLQAEPLAVVLAGLRALRDWRHLLDKLPDPTSGLISASGRPRYHLNRQEWQLWEYSNGQMSLAEIAQKWGVPVLTVQKLAFRLLTVGIVAELPHAHLTPLAAPVSTPNEGFFQQLLTFLQRNLS
ncbi:MAG: DUF4388 domain-containing protein [Gloeomargarita sp. SKYG116]|nr:DUF4388 domain-containing protein [Gloeomargarita sp. SKYG116]MDW8401077.1 DUF4388 domain-containing protein [Gloeomargarita sp. SKYGB_i_bin116]